MMMFPRNLPQAQFVALGLLSLYGDILQFNVPAGDRTVQTWCASAWSELVQAARLSSCLPHLVKKNQLMNTFGLMTV